MKTVDGKTLNPGYKTTPGPWSWSGIDNHIMARRGNERVIIATVHDDESGDMNRALIAAAPSLLEACREALSMYEVQLQLEAANDPTCEKIRNAIARAEGTQ